MTTRPDPEAMDEYFTDCACLPDPLQPHHHDLARTAPDPHLPWQPVSVPEGTRTLVDGISPFV
jgi:hypothetical protein